MIASLKEFIQPYKSQKFGFSVNDAQRVKWDSSLNEAIFHAVEKGEQSEVLLAVMLLEGCLKNGSLKHLDLSELMNKIWLAIPEAPPRLASVLLRTIRLINPEFALVHVNEIGKLITSAHPLVRFETVQLIKKAELVSLYSSLESLKDDPYAAEVNMGGRYEFIIRNEAFEILSRHVGNWERREIYAIAEGGVVSYFWDWKPLLEKL